MQAPRPHLISPATPTKSRHARKWTPQVQMLLLLSIVDASPRSVDWDRVRKLMDERMGAGQGQGELVSVRALRSQLSTIRTDLASHSFKFSHLSPAKPKNSALKHKGFYHDELVILGDDEDDDNVLRAGRMREIGVKVEGGIKKEEGLDMVETDEGEGERMAKVKEKMMEMLGSDVGEDGWNFA
ncbi:hypothetical protein EX30DRAFT_352178 [Ascodesmis nigricans]|uniref:Uncharacterized protein n=1 Tax=Ascodesmis nigricans TaxID=341454 RepID=A0A4S2MJ77_9PEZI|nr:hypothetical protein EX30DRAFT_352178 [Ascodesmis nigricans]